MIQYEVNGELGHELDPNTLISIRKWLGDTYGVI